MVETVVEVENLYYSYNSHPVLRGINLEIRRGEIVAIMGENGAGKTTLIKHFNGLLKPKKGLVKVFGVDTRKVSVAELSRKVGLVFQNPDHQLFAETVEKEVEFALRNFGFKEEVIKRRVEWALNLMGLTKYRNRSPFTLSIGERKRLAIASVLSYDPELIIFDEPTAGQDFLQKERIAELLNLLRTQGKTVIIVTHDVEFVATRFERVIVMSQGRIIGDGSFRKILSNLEILKKARLLPPQIVKCAWLLSDIGIPRDIIYPEELVEKLEKILRR
ncbi:MAG: ABC transporter ATP-binding protein [Thermoprotei archaeon]|nr:MAG: ABC transporter ATP-binding protein [Thermoprotei archaeon]